MEVLVKAVSGVLCSQYILRMLREAAEVSEDNAHGGQVARACMARFVVDYLSMVNLPAAQTFFEAEAVGALLKPVYDRLTQFCKCTAALLSIDTGSKVESRDVVYYTNYNGVDTFAKFMRAQT